MVYRPLDGLEKYIIAVIEGYFRHNQVLGLPLLDH